MRKRIIYRRIQHYAYANYKKLDPKDFVLGDLPYNERCHLNSVQKVKEGKAVKVFACYAYDRSNNSQCIHFINQLKNGKYQDNTWGWIYEWCDYYLIKEISTEEQQHIWDSLENIRETLVNLNSTKMERFLLRIKAKDCI